MGIGFSLFFFNFAPNKGIIITIYEVFSHIFPSFRRQYRRKSALYSFRVWPDLPAMSLSRSKASNCLATSRIRCSTRNSCSRCCHPSPCQALA